MADKEAFAFRLENDTAEDVKKYVEERGVKKSDVLRRATKEYIDEQAGEDTQPDPRRSVSPVTVMGVVAIAVAPTLLATGYTGLGIGLGAVAAVYALLWVTAYDVVLGRHLDTVRDELGDVGGVVGFFQLMREDHPVEDPDTLVERAARADLWALGLITSGLVVVTPMYVAAQFGYFEPFLAAIGTAGALGIGLFVVVVVYGFVFLMGLSALATLALATAREGRPAPADDESADV